VSERACSFDRAAVAYERYRPEYPEAALRWVVGRLGLEPGARVLDLGAGTGKLTRGLAALGLDVVAVEPGAAMLEQLRAAVPGVEALRGSAEAIPLPDASVDAATAGQAFHWFDPERTLPELRRVLRPSGGLGLLWNWEDVRDPLGSKISQILRGDPSNLFRHDPIDPRFFERLDETVIEGSIATTPDALAAWVGTTSALLTTEPARRDELLAAIRRAAAEHGDRFDLARLTYAYAYRLVS
jgi:SAM-dependent methyltransferase